MFSCKLPKVSMLTHLTTYVSVYKCIYLHSCSPTLLSGLFSVSEQHSESLRGWTELQQAASSNLHLDTNTHTHTIKKTQKSSFRLLRLNQSFICCDEDAENIPALWSQIIQRTTPTLCFWTGGGFSALHSHLSFIYQGSTSKFSLHDWPALAAFYQEAGSSPEHRNNKKDVFLW